MKTVKPTKKGFGVFFQMRIVFWEHLEQDCEFFLPNRLKDELSVCRIVEEAA